MEDSDVAECIDSRWLGWSILQLGKLGNSVGFMGGKWSFSILTKTGSSGSDHHTGKELQVPLVAVRGPACRGTRFEDSEFITFAELE